MFENYRSAATSLTIIVDLRFHVTELTVHSAALYFEDNELESKEDAISAGNWTSNHMLSQYRKFAFDDDTSSVRNDDVESLMFNSYCMIIEETLEDEELACNQTDAYANRNMFMHGLDTGFAAYRRMFDKVRWYAEVDYEIPFETVGSIYTSGAFDLYDGFTQLQNQIISDVNSLRTSIDSNIQSTVALMFLFVIVDIILIVMLILDKLHQSIKQAQLFVKLLPNNVIESSPLIFYSCVNNDFEDDVDVAVML
eukprot:TRINITY_DN604962_c0_g1_i2.p1 TRINITY_DN604962_c0_g1~~TRINITY_DN604962_c0_g1_i2.p1  ORF type:complete len:253 (-),score=51.21 TRINITY_DN604962_c0_g1_i2:45-803(-)